MGPFSTLSKKYLMALSGIFLVIFLASHLSANLQLLLIDSVPFNKYVKFLASFGGLLYVAEIGLLFLFVLHIVTAVRITITNRKARPIDYKIIQSKGGPTKNNLASRNMAITGMIILVFLVIHVWQFRLGPGIEMGYATEIDGKMARDLYRLVVEKFQNPLIVIFYSFTMIILGFHLRHGFWSAFQSLGLSHAKYNRMLYKVAVLVAVIFAVGFLIIPIWIYFDFQGNYK